jgi:hypothetical protein
MSLRIRILALGLLIAGALDLSPAGAEPYLAVQTGYKCNVCHVNPTGGGLRSDFGAIFAKTLLPADTLGDQLDAWTGKLTERIRVGGDLRADWSSSSAPNTPRTQQFALEQFRAYADLAIIPEKLGIYVDEQIAPNGSQNMEAYVRYGSTNQGLYLKGGQFYLPFGWRLQDQTAFVREASGISMTTPDKGLEIGYELPSWSLQLDLTNGAANASAGSGHQVTAQAVYVKPFWRVGLAATAEQSDVGNRRVAGLFAGVRTGPIAWLGEADVIHDDSFPGGRTLAAGLIEGDWRLRQGHNLKFTAEYLDPDRAVREDQQVRYSCVYEYTPIPFLQFRAGYRRYRGIPQSNTENQHTTFLELHGYF